MELREVINEIGPLDVNFWLLQDIDQSGGYTFDIDYEDFAERTLSNPKGFVVSPDKFQIYYNSSMSLLDGTFIAINSCIEKKPLLVLEAFDASIWHVATTNALLINKLIKIGWEKSLYFPRIRGVVVQDCPCSANVRMAKNDGEEAETGEK